MSQRLWQNAEYLAKKKPGQDDSAQDSMSRKLISGQEKAAGVTKLHGSLETQLALILGYSSIPSNVLQPFQEAAVKAFRLAEAPQQPGPVPDQVISDLKGFSAVLTTVKEAQDAVDHGYQHHSEANNWLKAYGHHLYRRAVLDWLRIARARSKLTAEQLDDLGVTSVPERPRIEEFGLRDDHRVPKFVVTAKELEKDAIGTDYFSYGVYWAMRLTPSESANPKLSNTDLIVCDFN